MGVSCRKARRGDSTFTSGNLGQRAAGKGGRKPENLFSICNVLSFKSVCNKTILCYEKHNLLNYCLLRCQR